MKKLCVFLTCLSMIVVTPVHAKSVKLASKYAYVYDVTDEEVLYDQKGTSKIYPASMTKMMTVYTALSLIPHLNKKVTVTKSMIKNKTKYSAQMRDLLEEGDYITFESFLLQHNIPLNSEPYKEFQRLEYVANRYYTCVQLWEKIILRSDDPDYWDSSETDISNLCMYLDSFMEVYEYNVKVEKNEDIAAYMEDMNSDIRAMLRRYLQMTDDEVDEFLGYSQAKKAVAMEEILLREVPEDE